MGSGLAGWDDQYTRHAVWETIEKAISLTDGRVGNDEKERAQLDRLRAILRITFEWRDTPTLLVSPAMLSDLESHADQIHSNLDAWVRDGSPRYLDAAHSSLDELLEAARGWPPTKDKYARGLIATMEESGRQAEASLEALVSRADEVSERLQQELDAVSKRIEVRESQGAEAFQELLEKLGQIERSLEEFQATAERIDNRVDSVLTSQQNTFSAAEAERHKTNSTNVDTQKAAFTEALNQAVAESEEALSSQVDTGQAFLTRLEELETQAKNVVEATATASTSTDFGKYAIEQNTVADRFRYGAIGALIVAGVVVAVLIAKGGIEVVSL